MTGKSNMGRPFLGVFAVLGTWPNWTRYFDLSRRGLKLSFLALLAALGPLWISAFAVTSYRSEHLDVPSAMQTGPFILITSLYLLSFSFLVILANMVFEKMDRTRAWLITRHWAVLALASLVGAGFVLYLLDVLPFSASSGIALAAYLGLLGVDIRLAQKVAGYNLGTAILLSCAGVGMGLTIILLALSQLASGH